MKLARVVAVATFALALLAIGSPASSATDQVNARTEIPVDLYITATEFPCLVETLHFTATYEERLHVVFNPAGGYSFTVSTHVKDATVTGLTTGETYQYNGPSHTVHNGKTDEPWVTWYPIEYTFGNLDRFLGPGQLPNVYLHTLVHFTFDRVTGEIKTVVFKDDVRCE